MNTKQPFVYILTNKPRGVLYIGMTAYLSDRMDQHLTTEQKTFVRKYNLDLLVHIEPHDLIQDAASRKKQLKHWKRDWKIELIEKHNPEWKDLKHLLA
jgi:putative endonuclease